VWSECVVCVVMKRDGKMVLSIPKGLFGLLVQVSGRFGEREQRTMTCDLQDTLCIPSADSLGEVREAGATSASLSQGQSAHASVPPPVSGGSSLDVRLLSPSSQPSPPSSLPSTTMSRH
jgi:hypothetical protein